ncbi:MAG: CPBP family intramembrane metalloprotease [Gemmatimonadales bacterium]|nr:CPBP family intramembrane metalloprotease [Gemmatimonadales bacterium]
MLGVVTLTVTVLPEMLRPVNLPAPLWLVSLATAGMLGGILLFALGHYAPGALAAAQERFEFPILARILYGGITEEILLRWGLMTVLVWLLRLPRRGQGAPPPVHMWLAILASALLFGAGHLPAAAALVGELTREIVAFVVGANTAFGILFGYLYWRYGLEAAMVAHGAAHALSYVAGLL